MRRISDEVPELGRAHVAEQDGAEGADLLVGPDESRSVGSFIRGLFEAQDHARHRGDVEVHEGGEVDVLEHPVGRDELGALRPAGRVRDHFLEESIDREELVAIVVLNLGKDDLPVVVARTANRVVPAEFLGSEIGSHQGVIRPHDDVEMLFDGSV